MSLALATGPRLELDDGAFLRPLAESDVTPAYVDGLNDPQVNRFLVGPRSQTQTTEMVRTFVRSNLEDTEAILFGLFVNETFCGTSRLHDIRDRQAYLGIALFDRNVWGQGWARKVISAITDFAARDLGVREVLAGIETDNTASAKAFRAAGFTPAHPTEDGKATIWKWPPT